jgi:hypothetical protein
MTTIAQVKKWTRPLVEADARLTLIARNLILNPVGHLIRGIYVDRTSNRLQPKLQLYVQPLFSVPTGSAGLVWSRELSVDQVDQEGFEADFLATCGNGLDELNEFRDIDDFLRETSKAAGRPLGPVPIHRYRLRHALVLVAAGRFEEALPILAPALREEEEKYSSMLAYGQTELAKRPRSGRNTYIEVATAQLRIVASLEPLIAFMNAGDRRGIASLLRRNEERNAEVWQVRDIWRPSPFPFELGADD